LAVTLETGNATSQFITDLYGSHGDAEVVENRFPVFVELV
jgi:hypothetical protein